MHTMLDRANVEWMKKALHEEVQELEDATSIVDQVDALLDACVFALGGLYKIGLTVEQAHACLDAIMDANMEKKAGVNPNRATVGVIDATKPDGWVPPEARMHKILFPDIYELMAKEIQK
jgi:predicted HAD superfamily Cof-like phosphohydrolase